MEGAPSRTAVLAAMGRAVHLLHHGPRALLGDWLAWPFVGAAADTFLESYRPLMADDEIPFATWFGARSRLDFETEEFASALAGAGFEPARPSFVSWLGVTAYLTREAIVHTLTALPPCSLAVGYVPPLEHQDADARRLGAAVEAQVEALGEPFHTLTTPPEFAALMAEGGFTVVEDVGAHDIEARYGLPALNYERMALARKA